MAKKRQAITPVDLITAINPFSTVAEQYRKIRTNIEFSSADKKIKSLVVTSSGPSEGKTTTHQILRWYLLTQAAAWF